MLINTPYDNIGFTRKRNFDKSRFQPSIFGKKKQAKKQILLACNEVQLYALTVYNTGSRSKKFLLDYIEIKLNKTMFLFFELIVSCLYKTNFSIKYK